MLPSHHSVSSINHGGILITFTIQYGGAKMRGINKYANMFVQIQNGVLYSSL